MSEPGTERTDCVGVFDGVGSISSKSSRELKDVKGDDIADTDFNAWLLTSCQQAISILTEGDIL